DAKRGLGARRTRVRAACRPTPRGIATSSTRGYLSRASGSEALAQQVLALLAALPAGTLRAPEELGELIVAVALGVLDVVLEPQRIAQALLGEPDQVVVLVLGPGDLACLARCRHVGSPPVVGFGSHYPIRAVTAPDI